MKNIIFCLGFLMALFLMSCDDMESKDKPSINSGGTESTRLFVLSEGLFNSNNSALATYNLNTKVLVSDFFLKANKRGLGDTANDMVLYGSKIYVVVNVSSTIEVLDAKTGVSLKQIAMVNDKNVAREPRNITFDGAKVYVCSFDGTVAKIDTTSLQIEAYVQCGKNPDGICVANNKLYVSNSGGLNYPNYDNTVSVIDLDSFTELKKISVGINPAKIRADSEGDVYLISRGDYGANPYKFQKINAAGNEFVSSFPDIEALNFTIHKDTAYIYNYDFSTQKSWVKVFDCKQDKIISDNFISDGTSLDTPFGIDVNPSNGDVYFTDAKSYIVWGDVLCFSNKGKFKFRLQEIGANPNKVVFANF